MITHFKFSHNFYLSIFISLALSICVAEIWIISSSFFAQNPNVFAFGITVDLVIVIPSLYYFLIVRKKQAPLITLLPVFVLSFIIASFILPIQRQNYLDLIKKTVPCLELIALGYLVTKLRVIRRNFLIAKQNAIYFTDALTASCNQVLGKSPALSFILTEFILVYLACSGWFKKFVTLNSSHFAFSYHRKNGYTAVFAVIIMILFVETTALHLLLQAWSKIAAWIFTGLSFYSLLWLLGDYQAIRLHPIVLSQEFLFIRTGLRWHTHIPLAEIIAVQKFNTREKPTNSYLSLSVFGEPRVLIRCQRPVVVQGLFGIKREVSCLGLTIDDEKAFLEMLQQRRQVQSDFISEKEQT